MPLVYNTARAQTDVGTVTEVVVSVGKSVDKVSELKIVVAVG